MIERKKRTLMIVGNVMLAVAVAYTFRFIGKGDFYSILFSYLRSFIYIGLFTAWGAFRPSSHSSETGNFENREALVATAIENKLTVTTLKDE